MNNKYGNSNETYSYPAMKMATETYNWNTLANIESTFIKCISVAIVTSVYQYFCTAKDKKRSNASLQYWQQKLFRYGAIGRVTKNIKIHLLIYCKEIIIAVTP